MVKKFKVIKKRGMAKRVVRRGEVTLEEGSDRIIMPTIDETKNKQEQEILNETSKAKVEAIVIPPTQPVNNISDIVKKARDSGDMQDLNQPEVPVIQVAPVVAPQPIASEVLPKTFFQKVSDKFKGTPKTEEEKKVRVYNSNDDKLAIRGGSQYVYLTIKNEELAINEYEEKQKEELEKLQVEEADYDLKLANAQKKFTNYELLIDSKKEIRVDYENSQEHKNDMLQLRKYKNDFNLISNRRWRILDERSELQKNLKSVEKKRSLNKEKLAKYDRAIEIGKLEFKKESGWRQEAKSFSDNATSMIGAPKIANADTLVGYGKVGSDDISRAFGNLIAPVSVGPNANNWARTRVGDRALVEDLVRVNQNRMITPFGVPGTVAGGNTSKQFAYNIPLNKIGVGDVTARGGYRINIEDIRRKKAAQRIASKPIVIRKKIKLSTKKASISSVGGNLNIDMPKSTVVANIGKTKPLKLNMDILVNTTSKPDMKLGIGNLKNMKLNITPININADKPQSGSVKLNTDSGIIPYTFKNIEVNLNTVSSSVKKKMKVKS